MKKPNIRGARAALRRAVAEVLEPRRMLSDDFDISYSTSPQVATVSINTAGISINVSVDCDSVTVNGETPGPAGYEINLVEIYGTGGNDHVTVSCSCNDDYPPGVRVYAGWGDDLIDLSGFDCGG